MKKQSRNTEGVDEAQGVITVEPEEIANLCEELSAGNEFAAGSRIRNPVVCPQISSATAAIAKGESGLLGIGASISKTRSALANVPWSVV